MTWAPLTVGCGGTEIVAEGSELELSRLGFLKLTLGTAMHGVECGDVALGGLPSRFLMYVNSCVESA